MRILFVVTARGGSKGVPKKNILKLGPYPLIAYKIISSQKCKYDNRLIVSTDSDEIADVARGYGAEVPFIRPPYLATDTADSMDVVIHAINWVEANDDASYDYICLLEPSSPFLSYADIDRAFDMIIDQGADTLLGVKKVEVSRKFIYPLDKNGKLSYFYETLKDMKRVRRQDQEPEYTINGCIYVARWEYFKNNHIFHSMNSIPYVMPFEASIEIDSYMDYEFAKFIVEKGLIDISKWG